MERSRSRILQNVLNPCQTRYKNGYVVYFGPPYWNKAYNGEEMTDVLTPGYDPGSLNLPENPCVYTHTTIESVSGSYTYSDVNGFYSETSGGCTEQVKKNTSWTPSQIPTVRSTLVEEAKQQAIASIDAPDHAFGQDIAEFRETARFIKNPLKSLASLGKRFRKDVLKRNSRHPRSVRSSQYAKDLSDTWLTYRFAAVPLVRSIEEALDAYSTGPIPRPAILRARGFAQDEDRVSGIDTPGVSFSYTTKKVTKVAARIRYSLPNPCTDVKHLLGLRNRDLPETLWDILPYSFLIDRVANISNAIAGVRALTTPGLSILGSVVVTREEVVEDYQLIGIPPPPGYTISMNANPVRETVFSYQRDLWEPSLADIVPPVTPGKLVDSAKEIADLAALVLQRWR